MRSFYLDTNNTRLHIVEAGDPESKRHVIFLHGFPEYWWAWRYQIDYFLKANYRIWMPDLRGYNRSQGSQQLTDYSIDMLTKDILGVMDAAGFHEHQGYLVGHGWGGVMVWWLANKYRSLLRRAAIINAPHYQVWREFLRQDDEQQQNSRYLFNFQIQPHPEHDLQANDYHALVTMMYQMGGVCFSLSPQELTRYKTAWSRPHTISHMLNYYRAMFTVPTIPAPDPTIKPTTLLLWGQQNTTFTWRMAKPSIRHCEKGHLILLPNVGHWAHQEAADTVNKHIVSFFR